MPLELNSQVVPTAPGENLEVPGPCLWRLAEALVVAAGWARVSVMSSLVISCLHNNPKLMGFSKSSAKGKFHSSTNVPQETGEKSNK